MYNDERRRVGTRKVLKERFQGGITTRFYGQPLA